MDLTAVAHARQFAKQRYNVQQQSRRERDACTPRRQPHWLAARGSYPAPTEGSCAPSRPLVCPSVRPSHVTRAARCAHRPEKSLRVIEKSMSAWRAGSRPAATNGCHGARTGAKEASAVSGSREGGGRGAHGRRALAAEEEMAESRQSVCGASQGATAVPAYRSSPMRLAIVVEDLYPEGGRKISHLHHANEKSDGQQGSLCKSARRLHREVLAPWDELSVTTRESCSDHADVFPFRDFTCSLTAQNLAL